MEQAVELYTKSGADTAFLTQTAADSRYLGAAETAMNADQLDGLDSTDFLPFTNCTGLPRPGIDWHGCDFVGVHLSDASLRSANLRGSNLSNLTNLTGADLQLADLTGANMNTSVLIGANLSRANLTDADLHFSNLTGAGLVSVIWSNTTCPDGTNSDNNGGTCIGHLF